MNPHPEFKLQDDRFSPAMALRAEFARYDNGRAAVKLVVDGNQGDSFDGEPWSTASVNVPEAALEPWQVVIKDWGENQGMAAILIRSNLIQAQSVGALELNHVTAQIFAFTPQALEAIEQTAPDVPQNQRLKFRG